MSRLERLVLLLDQGSSSGVKRNASIQLAQIASTKSEVIPFLLGKIVPLLESKNWETRAQAAATLGLIKVRQHWILRTVPFLDLDDFRELKNGMPLLESPGDEYEAAGMEAGEQKRLIKEKLGLELGMIMNFNFRWNCRCCRLGKECNSS